MSIYSSLQTEVVKKYYVYVYFDVRDGKQGIPIYVGKGTRKRAYKHIYDSSNEILKRIILETKKLGLQPDVKIIGYFDDELQALNVEKHFIDKWKRLCDGGTLTNFTTGGDGGLSGYHPTKETRNKISSAHIGKKCTEETREKIRKANLGKKPSKTTREKLSRAARNKKSMSVETKQKMSQVEKTVEHRFKLSQAAKGRKLSSSHKEKISNGNKGKIVSEETKMKLKDARQKQICSEETRKKRSESMKAFLRNKNIDLQQT